LIRIKDLTIPPYFLSARRVLGQARVHLTQTVRPGSDYTTGTPDKSPAERQRNGGSNSAAHGLIGDTGLNTVKTRVSKNKTQKPGSGRNCF
jgi:hypothetical protein